MYDLIGDIHGHSEPLVELLERLGYRQRGGVFRHADRQVIFLGDFIDRGPNQREVIEIVRPMIDEQAALTVMGNHEFNAIAYYTEDPREPGSYLRPHNPKNNKQHNVFLSAFEGCSDYGDLIEWFRGLPLWLDFGNLRIIHACWDENLIALLERQYDGVNRYLCDEFLVAASSRGSDEFQAAETLLKGKEIRLPGGQSFLDKDGNPREEIRVRWWDSEATTYRKAFLGPQSAARHIPDDPLDATDLKRYPLEEPPVFVGHYWMEGDPEILAPNVACLDYSIAAPQAGKLVAYRWDGENRLDSRKFVWVQRTHE